MTGGGAWALGLQSDRGLLAPSMRADLVVVAGDPTVSLDALAQVERVFLGGVDVDRATLMRPPPEPAAPTAAAPAPAPAPPASSKAAPAPARGRARGAKGAKTAPPPATPRRGGNRHAAGQLRPRRRRIRRRTRRPRAAACRHRGAQPSPAPGCATRCSTTSSAATR